MSNQLIIRPVTPEDVTLLFDLIKGLADYEKLSHIVTGNTELLTKHLFSDRPFIYSILAEYDQKPVGFALYFFNYSTFLTKPGIYLEDLFVIPEYRGKGIGKALLNHLGKIALENDCGRIEWSVLDWNQPAIEFYQYIGAEILPDWRICRVTGEGIKNIAEML